jgi:hypothetical protein
MSKDIENKESRFQHFKKNYWNVFVESSILSAVLTIFSFAKDFSKENAPTTTDKLRQMPKVAGVFLVANTLTSAVICAYHAIKGPKKEDKPTATQPDAPQINTQATQPSHVDAVPDIPQPQHSTSYVAAEQARQAQREMGNSHGQTR